MCKPPAEFTSPSKAISSPTELESEGQFIAARELLSKLIGLPAIQKTFDPDAPPNSRMVYINSVTLWMLILQRLGNGKSLYMVSNLEADATSAAELYSYRYDVEFDIRDLKVTMDT